MLSLNKKILVSGCGMSWSRQERKTWINILRAIGVKLTDVSGPAVSNQWILNKIITNLYLNKEINTVIVQLTSLGKLDVDISEYPERKIELVDADSLRNFVIDGVWPSSASTEHASKQHWNKWLASPRLEKEDIFCKLILLSEYCKHNNIKLYVFQGYEIYWTVAQYTTLKNIIVNIDYNLYQNYTNSEYYQLHDYSDQNSVPCVAYQCLIAETIANILEIDCTNKLARIKSKYNQSLP
jgi:hypothetical protein